MASLNQEQREALVSKYVILCPPILFTEIARHGLSWINKYLNLENIVSITHWSEYAKMDLLTETSAKPTFFGSPSGGKTIVECSEQELLMFKELSGEIIDTLIENEDNVRTYLDSAIDPWKEELLGLVDNTENLKAFMKGHPEIERILKVIDEDFHQERKQRLRFLVDRLCDLFKADSLESAYRLTTTVLNHDPISRSHALGRLQWLCGFFDLTQDEHTQVINRFLAEDMPPIRRFAPYALGVVVWYLTIHLYLRENPENAAPKDILRDAQYLFYTYYKNITFCIWGQVAQEIR